MDSVGVFRKGEINGKSFLIYTVSSQTQNPSPSSSSSGETSIDSGGDNDDDLSLDQPRFLCPSSRYQVDILKLKSFSVKEDFLPLSSPPHFPNISSGLDQEVLSLLVSDSHKSLCKLPVSLLFWCNNKERNFMEFSCGACLSSQLSAYYYLCVTCGEMFHKECVESPLRIKHPSYPFASFKLHISYKGNFPCISCERDLLKMCFRCPTYGLYMHPVCAMKPIPYVIDHPKRHPHSLTFFPKQSSLACNVCGLVKECIPTYVCVQCVFVVHQDCIYFPYVIRISRHQHRISLTYSLPSGKLSCGVCRQKVDNNYSAYSCNKCDDYFVHSRCATRRDLWDGEELEGIPEEPEIVVDPFERIADGIILHFSHDHHLKLKISRAYDDAKLCQGCVLPIYEGSYYSCVDQCDFILHEACAISPLKKDHPLHARSLTLKVVPEDRFRCDACLRQSCGFVYEDLEGDWKFRLDLRCASVNEPFKYEGHEHPLYLALTREKEKSTTCRICGDAKTVFDANRKLNCIECDDYIVCFKCATLPYKARYKHDKHFLTFREGKEGSDESGWCEVCERKMVYSREKGFYACDKYCCTTLHVVCLLGKHPYMKPGRAMKIYRGEVLTLGNNTMSRPFCHGRYCKERRCLHKVIFERKNITFCSFSCLVNT